MYVAAVLLLLTVLLKELLFIDFVHTFQVLQYTLCYAHSITVQSVSADDVCAVFVA
jgi:hypothetical protein